MQGSELAGDFAIVDNVDLNADVFTLKERIKASRSRLRYVELDDMVIFGGWPFDDIPADVKDATTGWGRNPLAILNTLVGATGDCFFIVRIPVSPPEAAAGASANAIVGLPP